MILKINENQPQQWRGGFDEAPGLHALFLPVGMGGLPHRSHPGALHCPTGMDRVPSTLFQRPSWLFL